MRHTSHSSRNNIIIRNFFSHKKSSNKNSPKELRKTANGISRQRDLRRPRETEIHHVMNERLDISRNAILHTTAITGKKHTYSKKDSWKVREVLGNSRSVVTATNIKLIFKSSLLKNQNICSCLSGPHLIQHH